MTVPLTVNGVTFQYPVEGDVLWGPAATNWATAVTNGTLQKTGGLFSLSSDVDFGPTGGLDAIFHGGRGIIASTGLFRAGNTQSLAWRNAANTADATLVLNSSDALVYSTPTVSNAFSIANSGAVTMGNLTLTTLKVGPGAAANSSPLMVNTVSGVTAGIQLFQDGNESWQIQNPASTTALTFANSGTERMRLSGTGNLGLGRTPAQSLDVQSASAAIVRLRGGSGVGQGGGFYVTIPGSDSTLVGIGDRGTAFGTATGSIASIYTPPSIPLTLDVAASERMRIDTSGNVGIGGSSSGDRLHVFGNTRTTLTGGSGIYMSDQFNTVSIRSIPAASDSAMGFYTQATNERMRIDAAGNVGIGATSPDVRLRVDVASPTRGIGSSLVTTGSTGSQMMLSQSGVASWAIGQPAGVNAFAWYTGRSPAADGTEVMRIDAAGNVGIGTASPSQMIDVNGGTNAIALGPKTASSGAGALIRWRDDTATGRWAAGILGTVANTTWSLYNLATTTEAISVLNSGFVGINTASPSQPLDVNGSARVRNEALFYSTTSDRLTISPQSAGNGVNIIAANNAGAAYAPLQLWGSDVRINISGTERVRIDAAGNIGVGTTPAAWNNNYRVAQYGTGGWISGRVGSSGVELGSNWYRDAGGNYVRLALGSAGHYSIEGGDHVWSTAASGGAGTTFTPSERMRISTAGDVLINTSSAPAYTSKLRIQGGLEVHASQQFNTVPGNTNAYEIVNRSSGGFDFYPAPSVQAVRIAPGGELMVGTTGTWTGNASIMNVRYPGGGTQYGIALNSAATTTTTAVIFLNGGAANGGAATTSGSITQTSTTVAYNTSSDARMKENVTDAPAGNVDDIKVRSFDWKITGVHQDYGFIAQELVEVAPYAVHVPENDEQMMAVDYSKLVPMLVKEIQDLRKRVADLEKD